ncbi:MAG: phage portal protein [Cetobacterium sp.]
MRKIKLDKETVITKELIEKLIKDHSSERNRILKMKKYYNNQNDILNREYADTNKPMNKLSHNFAGLITDNYVGYMVGEPVSYKSDNESLLVTLNENFIYNDEIDNNTTLAQEQSICGYAYELLYNDEEGTARFKCVDTEEMIVVYDNTLEEKELFAIRYVRDSENKGTAYIYSKEVVEAYALDKESLGELIDSYPNLFDDVPICSYENNRQRLGDFEKVITLIDAYDKTNSDTANDFEYFTNALLVVAGVVMEEDSSNPLDFKNNRVLNFADTDSRAEYLLKNINDSALENYKNRLVEDIHKFSKVPNMADENFSSNASGVALKFKFNGMELNTSIKESKFKKGLMKRIELLTSFLNIKTNSLYAYTEIKPVFTRNIPSNEVEVVEMVKSLYGIISDQTLLSQLPFIEDVQSEIDAITKQKENTLDYQGLGVADEE